ncbi:hypothetical protein WJX84_012406, partial [Apatococcus fuscideae]
VLKGVEPNEHGTWQYGRNGWCDGQQVEPTVFDVTEEMAPAGSLNHVSYQGLFQGKDPDPQQPPGYIMMQSSIILCPSEAQLPGRVSASAPLRTQHLKTKLSKTGDQTLCLFTQRDRDVQMSSSGYSSEQQGYAQPKSPIGVTRAGRLDDDQNPFGSAQPVTQATAYPSYQSTTQSNLGADPFNSGYAPMREGLGSGMAPPTPSPQVPSQRTAGIYESVRHDNASTPSGFGSQGTYTSQAIQQAAGEEDRLQRDYPGSRSSRSSTQGGYEGRARSPAPDYRSYEREAEQQIARSPRYATPPRSPRAGGIGDYGLVPRSPTPQGFSSGTRSPQAGGFGDHSSGSQGSAPRSPRAGGISDYSTLSQGSALRSPRTSDMGGDFGIQSGSRSPQVGGFGDYGSAGIPRSPRAGGAGDYGGRSRSPAPDQLRSYERAAEEQIARSPRYATPPRGRMGDQSPPIQASAYQASSQDVTPLLGSTNKELSAPVKTSAGVGGTKDFGAALEPLATSGTGQQGLTGSSGRGVVGTAQEYGQGAAQRVADAARSTTDTAKEYMGYGQPGRQGTSASGQGSAKSYSSLETGPDYTGSQYASEASRTAADAGNATQASAQGTAQEIKELLGSGTTGPSSGSGAGGATSYGGGPDRTYGQAAYDTVSKAGDYAYGAAASTGQTVKDYMGGSTGTAPSGRAPSGYSSGQTYGHDRTYTQAAADAASNAAQATKNAAVSAGQTVKDYTVGSTGTASSGRAPSGYSSGQTYGDERTYTQAASDAVSTGAQSTRNAAGYGGQTVKDYTVGSTATASSGRTPSGYSSGQTYGDERTYTQAAADAASTAAQATKNAAASAADTVKGYTGLGQTATPPGTGTGAYSGSTRGNSSTPSGYTSSQAPGDGRTYTQAATDYASQTAQATKNAAGSAADTVKEYTGLGTGGTSQSGTGGYHSSTETFGQGDRTYGQAAEEETGKTSEYLAQQAGYGTRTGTSTVPGTHSSRDDRSYTGAASDYANQTAQATKNAAGSAVETGKDVTGAGQGSSSSPSTMPDNFGERAYGRDAEDMTAATMRTATPSTGTYGQASNERTYTQALADAAAKAAHAATNAAATAVETVKEYTGVAAEHAQDTTPMGDRSRRQAASDYTPSAKQSTMDTLESGKQAMGGSSTTGTSSSYGTGYGATTNPADRTYGQAASDTAAQAGQYAKNTVESGAAKDKLSGTSGTSTGSSYGTGYGTSGTSSDRTYGQAAHDTAADAGQYTSDTIEAAKQKLAGSTSTGPSQGSSYSTGYGSGTATSSADRTYGQAAQDTASQAGQYARETLESGKQAVGGSTGSKYGTGYGSSTSSQGRTFGQAAEEETGKTSEFLGQQAGGTKDELAETAEQAKRGLTTSGNPYTEMGKTSDTQSPSDKAAHSFEHNRNAVAAAMDSVSESTGFNAKSSGYGSTQPGSGTTDGGYGATGQRSYGQAASDTAAQAGQHASDAAETGRQQVMATGRNVKESMTGSGTSSGPTITDQVTGAAQQVAGTASGYATAAADAARDYARSAADAVTRQMGSSTSAGPTVGDRAGAYASSAQDRASRAGQATQDSLNRNAPQTNQGYVAQAADTVKGYAQAATDKVQQMTQGSTTHTGSAATAVPSTVERVVGMGQQAYHAVADKATEVGVGAQQQLAHAAQGDGVGARVAGGALGGIQATSNVASQAVNAADRQLAAAGADETTRARLARIGIAGILIFPVLGFNLLYTFGAMIVITFVSLVSRIFEGPSTTASSTTTAGQGTYGWVWLL